MQFTKRARNASASRLRRLVGGIGRAARHDEYHRPHDVFIADVVLVFGLVQLQLRFDILVPDFQTGLETSAHKIGPGHLRPQSPLEGVVAGAAGGENLRQLLCIQSPCGWRRRHRIDRHPSRGRRGRTAWPRLSPRSRRSGCRALPCAMAAFCCSSAMNLARCSMSRLVIGWPLTNATTCCASAMPKASRAGSPREPGRGKSLPTDIGRD